MPFRGKPLAEITEADIQRLIDVPVEEGWNIDYKRDMYGKNTKEMLKGVAAFANAQGGYIVVGAEEHNRIPVKVIGIERGNHDQRVKDSCLASIDPRIPGLDAREVPVSNGLVVLVIRIPESVNGPHMVTLEGLYQFWARHGASKAPMTTREIEEAFERRFEGLSKLERFLAQREADNLEAFAGQPWVVIRAVPLRPREGMVNVSSRAVHTLFSNAPRYRNAEGVGVDVPRYTLEGLRAELSPPPATVFIYLEAWRNGFCEFAYRLKGDEKIYPIGIAQLAGGFICFVEQLQAINTATEPVVFCLDFYNVRGHSLGLSQSSFSLATRNMKPWEKEHLKIPPHITYDVAGERDSLVQGLSDRLSNAFGLESIILFDGQGNWRR